MDQKKAETIVSAAIQRFKDGQTQKSTPSKHQNKAHQSGRASRRAMNQQAHMNRVGGISTQFGLAKAIYAPMRTWIEETNAHGVTCVLGWEPFKMCNTRTNEEGLLAPGVDPRTVPTQSGRINHYTPGRG